MSRTARFRRCPICASDAVSQLIVGDVDDDDTTVEVRCGSCATWRSLTVRRERAAALEQRLERMARRHRRAIEDDLRHVRLAGLAAGDFTRRPEITTPLP